MTLKMTKSGKRLKKEPWRNILRVIYKRILSVNA
jgi:hypothetical protein